MINVAILGYGTVGSGVYEIITENNDIVSRNAGDTVRVKHVLDLREFPGDPVSDVLTHDYEDIVNDPEVDVVIEVMGGVEPANTFVRRALEAGKCACTSNKALIASCGSELLRIAKEHDTALLFEASVGGGIPIIRAINESLTSDHFDKIYGILNGTTNYILTKMADEGASFDSTLKDAQDRGYAERDPEADIEGYDTCRKIAILTSLITGRFTDYEKIPTEGITGIANEDIDAAKALGMSVKLLGMTVIDGGNVYPVVAPFMVKKDDPMYGVSGVYNAVALHGDMLGNVMLYGEGAGKEATASAVVSDVIEIARRNMKSVPFGWSSEETSVSDIDEYGFSFYVRADGISPDELKDRIGAVSTMEHAGDVIAVTPVMKKKALTDALEGVNIKQIIRIN